MTKPLVILLFALSAAFADESSFDGKFVDSLPAKRAGALAKSKITASDSTPEIHAKRENYYSALKRMIQGIRSRYYLHTEFPKDICAGLEQHAVVLAGIEYPLSGATGSSGYDGLIDRTKIRLAEEMICRMSQVIYEEGYRDQKTGKTTKKSEDMYRKWLKNWHAKGSAE